MSDELSKIKLPEGKDVDDRDVEDRVISSAFETAKEKLKSASRRISIGEPGSVLRWEDPRTLSESQVLHFHVMLVAGMMGDHQRTVPLDEVSFNRSIQQLDQILEFHGFKRPGAEVDPDEEDGDDKDDEEQDAELDIVQPVIAQQEGETHDK